MSIEKVGSNNLPRPLATSFYRRRTDVVARALIGKTLLRQSDEGLAGGIIVETEAYMPQNDPACHANRCMTARNEPMFGPPGKLYVYTIHAKYCLNAVTESKDKGCAVLIRAVEPIWGIPLMQRRRGYYELLRLCRGPSMLCQALNVDLDQNRIDITTDDTLWIGRALKRSKDPVFRSARIGISQATDLKLRFFQKGSAFVSGRRQLNLNEAEPC